MLEADEPLLAEEGRRSDTLQHQHQHQQHRPLSKALLMCLWLVFGMGPSFTLQGSLYLEMPWFQDTQPEGVSLTSSISLGQVAATPLILGYLFAENKWSLSQDKTALRIAALPCVFAAITAAAWREAVGGFSVTLFVVMMAFTVIGVMQTTVVIPWMAWRFDPVYISALVTGGELANVVTVGMAIAQRPGGVQLFTPTVYYLVLSGLFLLSPIAGTFLLSNAPPGQELSKLSPLFPASAPSSSFSGPLPDFSSHHWRRSLTSLLFPPWWRGASVYLLMWAGGNALTWWVALTLIPYAAANTCDDSHTTGTDLLQWLSWIGEGGALVGSGSSILAKPGHFHLKLCLFLMTLFVLGIVVAAAGLGHWRQASMRYLLCSLVFGDRVLFGWMSPLIFREIASRFPDEGRREGVSRHIAVWSQLISIPWLVAVYVLIKAGVF